jgi:hypothetical protein
MADWTLFDGAGTQGDDWTNGAQPLAITLTHPSVANTYGPFVTLSASLPFDICGIDFMTGIWNGDGFSHVFDLATGSAGNEQVFAQAICVLGTDRFMPMHFPCCLPKGARLSARQQSNTNTAISILLASTLRPQTFMQGQMLQTNDVHGYNSGTSTGTVVDPGGSAYTKGSWAQIVSSTPRPASAIAVQIWPNNNTGGTNAQYRIDVGVGGAGSEKVVLGDLWMHFTSNVGGAGQPSANFLGPFPCSIPAGSRLSMRCECNLSSSGPRETSMCLRTFT